MGSSRLMLSLCSNRTAHWASALAVAMLTLGLSVTTATGQEKGEDRVVVMVFPRGGADPNVAVRIERDLRNLFDSEHLKDKKIPRCHNVELRFDVGVARRGELDKALSHFNNAQRYCEKNDFDEARGQLLRARRKYKKALPFAMDPALLGGIYYYEYLSFHALKQEKKATEAYCAYVALTRNHSGGRGPLEMFEPLADKCGDSESGGDAELTVTSNVDGAHVYLDGVPSGVIGLEQPYSNPFLQAGPHMVEVRKAGYARWGTLVELNKGGTASVKARLKRARNYESDYARLANIKFSGDDADSESYLIDQFFELTELYGVGYLVAGYLELNAEGQQQLSLITFHDFKWDTHVGTFDAERDAHRSVLAAYWKEQFGKDADPNEMEAITERMSPTMFKVD